MQRFIKLLGLVLLSLQALTAQDLPVSSPPVLVIGRNGLSPNEEASPLELTNTLDAATGTNTVAVADNETAQGSSGDAVEAAAPAPVQPVIDWDPLVSAMEMMVEQQKISMVAMEKNRAESALAASEATLVMRDKMESMERALAEQRQREAESMARMNRLVIGVAAGFAGTGFVVMVFTAWFFMRTMSKVSEINADLHSQLLALPQIHQAQLGNGAGVATNPASQRLIVALEQLEKRIRELEHTSDEVSGDIISGSESVETEIIPPPAVGQAASEAPAEDGRPAESTSGENEEGPSVETLLAKGQTLMNLDQPGDALGYFNKASKLDPRNAEALLKKGTALERLRRMHEAIDAYDGAIAIDETMTMAYLAKGGLCNRMERYSEALECYEKALQSQQQAA